METIVCIPITCEDHDSFRDRIMRSTKGEYLFAGRVLMKTKDGIGTNCELHDHDPKMGDAFRIGGRGRIDEETLEKINHHQTVLYLLWDKPGLDDLHHLHQFINVILSCCGCGVKFENSGVAHSVTDWLGKDFYSDTNDLMNSHVMLVGNQNGFYSSGMHIFGLPDVAVDGSVDNNYAGSLLFGFNHYQLFESPVLKDGNTFSLSEKDPYFRITRLKDWVYKGEEAFENPFGRYSLEPIDL